MRNNKKYIIRCKVIGVTLIYLLVVSTHIFFLQRITAVSNHNANSIFKRKIENVQSVNGLDRVAQAIFKQRKSVGVSNMNVSTTGFSLNDLNFKNLLTRISRFNTRSLWNHRYSYLSFSTFRI